MKCKRLVSRLVTVLNEADQCGVICKLQELDRGIFSCAVVGVQLRSVAWELQEHRSYRAMFPDFVAFIERHVKILSDPLFGDLQGTPPDPSFKYKSRHTGRGQATVAAIKTASGLTTSAAWHQQRKGPTSQKNDEVILCV